MDNCGLLSALPALIQSREEQRFFMIGNRNEYCAGLPESSKLQTIREGGALPDLNITAQDRVIIHFLNPVKRKIFYDKTRAISETVPILMVVPSGEETGKKCQNTYEDSSLGIITIESLLKTRSQEKWHQISLKRKIEKLKQAVNPDKPLLILTQPDPDPDAIASAMALQTILERNDKSAPIVTLKAVSRNENINMINIIGVKVKTITQKILDAADQIAMVDVQPTFFRRSFPNLRVVLDHHPVTKEYKAVFKDLQVTYGSTSTICTEYLLANESIISQKLATSLLYGIKTDTLLLGREVSKADFNAFVQLWPKADLQQVSHMERPCLKPQELDIYIKALKGHILRNGFLFVNLGHVPKEDLVPRLADFVMQIGKTDFAVVWGMVGEDSTFSARSQNPHVHAGGAMRTAFAGLGSAGGHKSMARATVSTRRLQKAFRVRSQKALSEILRKRLAGIIAKQKKEVNNKNG
jgi:nanoRNase/pAp phosphatase (c-di-AMP/oligoRNAs hydrolase)